GRARPEAGSVEGARGDGPGLLRHRPEQPSFGQVPLSAGAPALLTPRMICPVREENGHNKHEKSREGEEVRESGKRHSLGLLFLSRDFSCFLWPFLLLVALYSSDHISRNERGAGAGKSRASVQPAAGPGAC